MPRKGRRLLALGALAVAMTIAMIGVLQPNDHIVAASPNSRTLQTGWNLIAWLAEPMSAQELFAHADLPGLVSAVKWAVNKEPSTVVTRPTTHLHANWNVRPGDTLWVLLAQETTLKPFWLGESFHSGTTHRLSIGVNAVTWLGENNLLLSDIAASLPAGAMGVGSFDARVQRYFLYSVHRLKQDQGTPTQRIAHGDVIIVYSMKSAPWSQPYWMQANIIFGTDVPKEEQAAFGNHLAELESTLTSRFGLPAVEFEFFLARTWNALYDAFEAQGLGPFPSEARSIGNHCASNTGLPPHWIIGLHCRSRPNPADYSLTLGLLRTMGVPLGRSDSFASAMRLGFASYVRRALLNPEQFQSEHHRAIANSKNDSRVVIGEDPLPRVRGDLEYLFATFVSQRYGEESFSRYFVGIAELGRSSSADARAAELAFEAGEDGVAKQFASWRLVVAPPVSGSEADRIQIVGAADAALEVEIRETVLAVEEWTRLKFGHVFDPPKPWLFTTESKYCGIGWHIAVDIGGPCVNQETAYAHEFFHHVQQDSNRGLRLPDWFVEGTARYVGTLFGEHIGVSSYTAHRVQWVSAAQRFEGKLSDKDLVEYLGPSYYLGALATEWLVASAGENSYYDLLKQHGDSESFSIAFKSTFELDLDEFYRQYGIWRASGFPREDAGLLQ